MTKSYLGGSNLEGFWLSPRKEIIKTHGYRHIDMVVAMPDRFGIDHKFVQEIYMKHGEMIGNEGEARDEVLTHIIKQGWVKIRTRRNFISVQLWDFDYRDIDNLEKFARKGRREGFEDTMLSPQQEFRVMSLKRESIKTLTVKELVAGNLFEGTDRDGSISSLTEYINTIKQAIE